MDVTKGHSKTLTTLLFYANAEYFVFVWKQLVRNIIFNDSFLELVNWAVQNKQSAVFLWSIVGQISCA